MEDVSLFDRVILYNDKDGELEIALHCTYRECYVWGGMAICDLCNEQDSDLYLCPELGSKALCTNCFKEHKKSVKWYTEDTNAVFDELIIFVTSYGLYFSDRDYDMINQFFAGHKHPEIDIKRFLRK